MPRNIQTSDESGWTYVVKSTRSKPSTVRPSKFQHYANIEANDSETTEVLHEKLKRYINEWKGSSDARELAKILNQVFEFEPSLTVKKVVCIALGSPSGGHMSTWKQLGCLMDLRGSLFPTATMIFQDPVFKERDRSFFEDLDIAVVNSPNAFEEIDEQTFLFAPHCEYEQFCEALSGRQLPGLCITNDAQQYVRNYDMRRGASVKESSEQIGIALKIEESLRKREFPGNEKPEWYSTVIYALKSDEE